MNPKRANDRTIFISIASFCDPLLWYTVDSAVRNSAFPHRLHFCIVDQSQYPSNEVLKLASICGVTYKHSSPIDSNGACWARSVAMQEYKNQEYFLQIDSHMIFDKNWDSTLIAYFERIKTITSNINFVLSTRPRPFNITEGLPHRDRNIDKTIILSPKTRTITKSDPVIYYHAFPAKDRRVYRGAQISAAFIFTHGRVAQELPYNPSVYFHGEEQIYALRLYCAGWDIWHPPCVPLYHKYKNRSEADPPLHWDKTFDTKRSIKWAAMKRISDRIMWEYYNGLIDDIYKLSSNRSVSEYLQFAGLKLA